VKKAIKRRKGVELTTKKKKADERKRN